MKTVGNRKPRRRGTIVLRHALAVGVHEAEVVLGAGIALVGRRPPSVALSRLRWRQPARLSPQIVCEVLVRPCTRMTIVRVRGRSFLDHP